MRTTRCVWLAVALSAAAVSAHAQQRAPSDNELHSAYCIPIVKVELQAAEKATAAQEKSLAEINAAAGSPDIVKAATEVLDNLRGGEARFRAVLDRLQSYLLPKTTELDPMALLAAENRGKADWQSLVAMTDGCTKRKCGVSATDLDSECNKSCGMDKELVLRMRACNDPSWQPF